MRLYSLSVLYKGEPRVQLLKAAYDVSTFSFFQRSSVQEFMTFTSQLIVERSQLGSRASVKEQEYLCHVYVRSDGLAGVVIADNEYPQRVCFTLLDKPAPASGAPGAARGSAGSWPPPPPQAGQGLGLAGGELWGGARAATPGAPSLAGAGRVQQAGEQGGVALGVPRHHQLRSVGRVPQQVPEPPRRRPDDQGASGAGRDQNHPAQHHGVTAGTRGEAGRPGVQVGGAGGAVESLLQNRAEAELVLCGDVTPPRGGSCPGPARPSPPSSHLGLPQD